MTRSCRCCGAGYSYQRKRPWGTNYNGWRGWCPPCYRRWCDHGKPASGPPTPRQGAGGGPHPGRIEDYADLRSWGLTLAEAALRLGVTKRTAQRYEARLASHQNALESAA